MFMIPHERTFEAGQTQRWSFIRKGIRALNSVGQFLFNAATRIGHRLSIDAVPDDVDEISNHAHLEMRLNKGGPIVGVQFFLYRTADGCELLIHGTDYTLSDALHNSENRAKVAIAAAFDNSGNPTTIQFGKVKFDLSGLVEGDVNFDGLVNVADLLMLIANWDQKAAPLPPSESEKR